MKRNNYFAGKLLTEQDFVDEQEYYVGKGKLRNRCLYGYGIVCGLKISVAGNMIHINTGFALDCAGNEIIISEKVEFKLPESEEKVYVVIQYKEVLTDPVPAAGIPTASEEESQQYSRIEETFEISYTSTHPLANHKRSFFKRYSCGQDHGIPLGKLKYSRGRWKVSRFFCRPKIKNFCYPCIGT